jgi:hypothetical protein
MLSKRVRARVFFSARVLSMLILQVGSIGDLVVSERVSLSMRVSLVADFAIVDLAVLVLANFGIFLLE